MSTVDPKKPQSWSSLAKNIYKDLPSDTAPQVARPTAQPNWRKEFNQPRAPEDWMEASLRHHGLVRERK